MKAWQEDYLHEFGCVRDEHTLFHAISKFANGLGFEFCTHVLSAPWPLSTSTPHITSNYPGEWLRKYAANDYLAIDPVMHHSLSSDTQLVWDETQFGEAREFYEEACSEGVRYGWTIPSHCPGNVLSLLSLARSGEMISECEIRHKQFQVAWLAQTVRLGASRYLIPKLMPALESKLSDREIAVLRWTAEGKNSNDIAGILRISKRTVDFHANNAADKLGVPNRTAAAVLAAMLGLL